jgi:transcriptional regulator with XRE-family HTH domain
MNYLGNNLKKARLARGFTQDQVAQAIGLTRPTYALVEAGKRDIELGQAETLAAMLRVSIDELRGAVDGVTSLLNTEASMEKYKQIILNALEAGADPQDGKITKTKLAKLVYLADFTWYYNHLVPMSGMSYRRLPQGPVPDVYFRAIDELIEAGALNLEESGRAFMLSMAERGAAPGNQLSTSEKAMIHAIGKAWQGKQTQEIVNFTHEQLPWQICHEGEVIPYGLITQEEPEKVYGSARVTEL